jgi:hypothetical protein
MVSGNLALKKVFSLYRYFKTFNIDHEKPYNGFGSDGSRMHGMHGTGGGSTATES